MRKVGLLGDEIGLDGLLSMVSKVVQLLIDCIERWCARDFPDGLKVVMIVPSGDIDLATAGGGGVIESIFVALIKVLKLNS
jgi:hypothetical protein